MASLASLQANMNRDPKKQRKPYTTEDFCFFIDHTANKPEEKAATAYMALVKASKLPAFALAFFSDFKGGRPTRREWQQLAMVGDDVVLLAPSEIEGGFEGTLLAENSASGEIRTLLHDGQEYVVQIPQFEDFVYASNQVEIDLIKPPTQE